MLTHLFLNMTLVGATTDVTGEQRIGLGHRELQDTVGLESRRTR